MKVRLKVDISGTRNGTEWPRRGTVVDLPDDEAAQMCAAEMAEPVADLGKVETATAPAAEQRALTTESGPVKRAKAKQTN